MLLAEAEGAELAAGGAAAERPFGLGTGATPPRGRGVISSARGPESHFTFHHPLGNYKLEISHILPIYLDTRQ